jgi:hypothetical protein
MQKPIHLVPLLRLVMLALCLAPGTMQAQSTARTRVPVTIALVERLPAPDAPFVLLRGTAEAGGDVILLPADADAAVLSDAVRALLVVRGQQGDAASAPALLRFSAPGRGARTLPWASRVLADARRAVPREIEGVGTVPSVQVWLPRQGRRPPTGRG